MKYLKIAVDGRVEPVTTLRDLIASDGRTLYYAIPDEPEVVRHYPYSSDDIKGVTISKNRDAVSVEVQTSTDHRIKFLDPKKHSAGHFELLREFHNERAVLSLFAKISMDGMLVHPRSEILRVLTRDKKAYIMHGGVILSVGLTLRLTRVFGKVPDERVARLEVGSYTSATVQFSYEKLLCPRRDLTFEPAEERKEAHAH